MLIQQLRVRNYKGFRDSGLLDFKTGINLIIGQNSSGKTSLLEALQLDSIASKPHLSVATKPTATSLINEESSYFVSALLSTAEVVQTGAPASEEFHLHVPSSLWTTRANAGVPEHFTRDLLQVRDDIWRVAGIRSSEGNVINLEGEPPHGLYPVRTEKESMWRFTFTPRRELQFQGMTAGTSHLELTTRAAYHMYRLVHRFTAERFIPEVCPIGDTDQLTSNSSNLASAVNHLQNNPFLFAKFTELLQTVLPQVSRLTSKPIGEGHTMLRVWHCDPGDPEGAREDLSVPLSAAGSGVGQVAAILYVLVTAKQPQVLLIDEPQSFLHPGAARKLIEIINDFQTHQYFVTTHSPAVIGAANAATMKLCTQVGPECTAKEIDPEETRATRSFLVAFGARLSDMFGTDGVLWVEGATEELCFPEILRHFGKPGVAALSIIGLVATGDLEGRAKDMVAQVYMRMSRSSSLFPPTMGFVLDREGRTLQEEEEIRRATAGLAHFLPRRMFENYLLNPKAIEALINHLDKDEQAIKPTSEEIQKEIENRGNNPEYNAPTHRPFSVEWLVAVDGAKLLGAVVSEMTEHRLPANLKTTYGPFLTRWILQYEESELRVVYDFLDGILLQGGPQDL